MKKFFNIGVVLLLSFFIRFLYLGSVPVSLSHDETDNIIQAQSVIRTGHDLEGVWKPLDLLPNSGVMAELGPTINAPLLSILPNNLITDRMTTALLSSLFPILVWYWLSLLGVENGVAIITAVLLAFSPWHIITSRTVFEQPTSLFFYVLSWVFLARLMRSSKSIKARVINTLLFILTYAFGFYTYHGYKFSLPILTSIQIVWHYFQVKSITLRKLLVIPLAIIFLLLVRVLLYSSSYASRSGELLFSHTSQYETIVDSDRRLSLAPNFLKNIYSNKPLKLIQNLRDKYIMSMDMDLLYVHGESNGVFSTWQTGYLYLITFPFLLIGLGYLLLTHKKDHILILILLVISPIATTIHINNSLAFRSGIYFVLLNIITAYGLVQAHKQIVKLSSFYYSIFCFAFITIFMASFAYFAYIYFYVTPVTNANANFFGDRLVANYIRLSPDTKILLIVSQPRYLYSGVILTHSKVTIDDINSFDHHYSPTDLDKYETSHLTVARSCKELTDTNYDTVIISKNLLIDQGDCSAITKLTENNPKLPISSLVSPQDSGEEYRIIGDNLCQNTTLSTYVHPNSLFDLKLEQMDLREFCAKWVVKQ